MDDGFITPGERIPLAITEVGPQRRRAVAAHPEDRSDLVDFYDSSDQVNFDMLPRDAIPNRVAGASISAGCELALELLDRRISAGDSGLLAVKSVVQRCRSLLAAMPPLSHVDSVPLRPDDRLYQCFDQFLSLLRQQETQMQELQAMINELI
jgi:hypothetical protein